MFKKKFYNRALSEINNNFSVEKEGKRKQINELQNTIKKMYLDKLNEEQSTSDKIEYLELERLRLNEELGTNYNSLSNLTMAYIMSIFSAMAVLIIQTVLKPFTDVNIYYNILTICLFAVTVYCCGKYFTSTDYPKSLILNLSIKVVDDLEREVIKIQEDLKREAERIKLESNKVFSENKDYKNKVLLDIVAPAMLEVAASTLRKDSWIRKLFKKNK